MDRRSLVLMPEAVIVVHNLFDKKYEKRIMLC